MPGLKLPSIALCVFAYAPKLYEPPFGFTRRMLNPDSLVALSVQSKVTVVPDTVDLKLDGVAGAVRVADGEADVVNEFPPVARLPALSFEYTK